MQDVLDIQVTPLSAACGAEIKGIDVTRPLSETQVQAIKDAWAKHLVLVFRGQKVSQEDQLRFASYFGDLGSRKKAPDALKARTEGMLQDNEKVLLVTNIKVDGQPIGAVTSSASAQPSASESSRCSLGMARGNNAASNRANASSRDRMVRNWS